MKHQSTNLWWRQQELYDRRRAQETIVSCLGLACVVVNNLPSVSFMGMQYSTGA